MTNFLSAEEKEKILRALEIDKELRYALMGLLGYKEVLDRIVRLEERFADLEERFAKLEERFIKLEERFTSLEERFADLEERFIKLEERAAKLEERFIKLEERVGRVEEVLVNFTRLVNAIAHRYGVITEEGYREAMKYVVEELFGVAQVTKWVYYDSRGLVYQKPSVIEVDIVIKDKEHVLIEVKSRVGKSDLAELYNIGKLYSEVNNVKPRLVMLGALFDRGVEELARELGIELKPVVRELPFRS